MLSGVTITAMVESKLQIGTGRWDPDIVAEAIAAACGPRSLRDRKPIKPRGNPTENK